MNDDIYAEWLVKKKAPVYKIPALIGFSVLLVIAIYVMFLSSWGFLAVAAVVIGFLFVRRYFEIEYEYVFVTNELSVDKIFNQNSRKNAIKVEMSMVESVEETNPERNKNLLAGKNLIFQDFSSGNKDVKTYSMLYTKAGRHFLMTFEPNDKLLKAMWRTSPSKVKISK